MYIPQEWLNDETCYTVNEIDLVIEKIKPFCKYVGEGKIKYLNIPISIDLETSSFYDHGDKVAIMYVWMIGIYGLVIMGRTWDEYIIAYKKLCAIFRTCGNKRHMIWYIHNASFDFQFIRKHHNFIKVFATGRYAPLYAVTSEGVEMRCSLRLSSLSLQVVSENLMHHTIKKMAGDLDYRLIRHSNTPLTDMEKIYCTHDVKVVCAYIAECITDEGENISTIPLTSTGYVRRDCRETCFNVYNYKRFIHSLQLTAQDFNMSRDAFMGGFVHSNPIHTNKILYDVTSLDISSSYPTVMCAEKFPSSTPQRIKIETWSQLKYYLNTYNCIFTITIRNLKPRYHFDYYISASKCKKPIIGKITLSNGRVVYADEITITITELDFDIIEYMYKLNPEDICISDFIYFEKNYLPTPFVKRIINYYKLKTELADIEEYKPLYDKSKRMLNGNYGMAATSPVRPIIEYIDNEWSEPIEPDLESAIAKYNRNATRFLYYPWAVYVTAYARHNIWEAIIECGDDHVYTDTDSEKCLNFSAHAEFFEQYNERIQNKLRLACKVHGIKYEDVSPQNKHGKRKPLGIFKNEGTYSKFKTLGNKRYMYTLDGQMHIVASGVNPHKCMIYMRKTFKNEIRIYNNFQSELVIPKEYSGRMIHRYIDELKEGDVMDYLGNVSHYKELSAVHLEPSDYNFSVAAEFLAYIKHIEMGLFDL